MGLGFNHLRQTQIFTIRSFCIFALIAGLVIALNALAKPKKLLGKNLSLREWTEILLSPSDSNNCIQNYGNLTLV
jgi:hypothetical protein